MNRVKNLIGRHEDRERLLDWMNTHGINVNNVPLDFQVEIIDKDHMEIEVYDVTANGQKSWDSERMQPKMRWLHVNVKTPFPEDLLED